MHKAPAPIPPDPDRAQPEPPTWRAAPTSHDLRQRPPETTLETSATARSHRSPDRAPAESMRANRLEGSRRGNSKPQGQPKKPKQLGHA